MNFNELNFLKQLKLLEQLKKTNEKRIEEESKKEITLKKGTIKYFTKLIYDFLAGRQKEEIEKRAKEISLLKFAKKRLSDDSDDDILGLYNRLLFGDVRFEYSLDKGRVLKTNKSFKKYEIIFVEENLPVNIVKKKEKSKEEEVLSELFFQLSGNIKVQDDNELKVLSILKDNAFNTNFGTSKIFVLASMIEHSCIENCYIQITDDEKYLVLISLRDIEKDENLQLQYVFHENGFKSPMKEYRKKIKFRRGFHCKCQTCLDKIDYTRVFNCIKCHKKAYVKYLDDEFIKIEIKCSNCSYKFSKKERKKLIQYEKENKFKKLNLNHYLHYNHLNKLDLMDPIGWKNSEYNAERLIENNKKDNVFRSSILYNIELYDVIAQIQQKISKNSQKMFLNYVKYLFEKFKVKQMIRKSNWGNIERRDSFNLLDFKFKINENVVKGYLLEFWRYGNNEDKLEKIKNSFFFYLREKKILKIKWINFCDVCKKLSKFKCSRCKLAYYCDKNCQRKNWKHHKNVCKSK